MCQTVVAARKCLASWRRADTLTNLREGVRCFAQDEQFEIAADGAQSEANPSLARAANRSARDQMPVEPHLADFVQRKRELKACLIFDLATFWVTIASFLGVCEMLARTTESSKLTVFLSSAWPESQ